MRGSKPIIDAKLLEIVHYEVRAFTGRSPLRKPEAGKQAAIIDDLVSAGTEALIRAVENFDPSLGYKFKTYASKCVKNAIRRAARPRKRDALSHELVRLDAPIQQDDGLTNSHDIVPDDTGDDSNLGSCLALPSKVDAAARVRRVGVPMCRRVYSRGNRQTARHFC